MERRERHGREERGKRESEVHRDMHTDTRLESLHARLVPRRSNNGCGTSGYADSSLSLPPLLLQTNAMNDSLYHLSARVSAVVRSFLRASTSLAVSSASVCRSGCTGDSASCPSPHACLLLLFLSSSLSSHSLSLSLSLILLYRRLLNASLIQILQGT